MVCTPAHRASAGWIDSNTFPKNETLCFPAKMKSVLLNRTDVLDELRQHYEMHKDAIRTRLLEFKSVPASEYFFELAYCLLTPQSSAAHADLAVAQLREAGFQVQEIDPEPILRSKLNYVRFHRTKSKRLLQMKEKYPDIAQKLAAPATAMDNREWLVMHVMGLGYKEATHFLRNIGKNDGLAILDRHILRTLKCLGVMHEIPKSMNKKHYFEIENQFKIFAKNIGIVLDELDLVIWSMGTGEIRK
jgi:N-glycosylase/DNA lyase